MNATTPSQRTNKSTDQMSLFSLPPEIRDMIYKEALILKHKVHPYPRHPKSRRGQRLQESSPQPEDPADWLTRLLAGPPSRKALLYVCRQAYHECSSIYYGNNSFFLESGASLRDFVADHQPAHIQSIKRLSIFRSPSTTGADLGIVVREKYAIVATSDYGGASSLAILDHFWNLEELRLTAWAHESTSRTGRSSKRLLKGLVENARRLPNLRKITFYTTFELVDWIQQDDGFTLDFDDIPGWVYSTNAHKTRV